MTNGFVKNSARPKKIIQDEEGEPFQAPRDKEGAELIRLKPNFKLDRLETEFDAGSVNSDKSSSRFSRVTYSFKKAPS